MKRATWAWLAFTIGCSASGGGGNPGDPVGTSVQQMIGVTGGMVSTPAGASIVVPAGALMGDTVISITATAAVPPATFGTAVGVNYQFGPSGTLFLKPVTMNLPFGKLPSGVDASKDLQVLTAPDGSTQYTSLGPAKLIDSGHAGATTLHFSQCVVTTVPGGGGGGGGGGGSGGTGGGGGGTPGQCVVSCFGGSGSGGTAGTLDAGAPSSGGGDPGGVADLGGTGGSSGGGSGGAATCGCQDACMSTSYQLVCDGTNCSCIQNGVTTSMFAQAASCGNALDAWVTACGFPPSSGSSGGTVDAGADKPDASTGSGGGGPPDFGMTGPPDMSGTSMSCAPTCGGDAQNCMCKEDCNGTPYRLNCAGTACMCMTGGTSMSFTAAGAPCSMSDFHGICGAP